MGVPEQQEKRRLAAWLKLVLPAAALAGQTGPSICPLGILTNPHVAATEGPKISAVSGAQSQAGCQWWRSFELCKSLKA